MIANEISQSLVSTWASGFCFPRQDPYNLVFVKPGSSNRRDDYPELTNALTNVYNHGKILPQRDKARWVNLGFSTEIYRLSVLSIAFQSSADIKMLNPRANST